MSCRRVSSLLSAFVDSELTGNEMLAVRGHITQCADCQTEYESLVGIKRLLGSLPLPTPRTELTEALEDLPEYHPLAIRLMKQQREMRRVFGLASAAENIRALEQASGQGIGLACALGVIGAWFVVAPAAVAPVASPRLALHARACGDLSQMNASACWPDSILPVGSYDGDDLTPAAIRISPVPVTSWGFSSASSRFAPARAGVGFTSIDVYPSAPADNFALQSVLPHARLYSAKLNASR